MSTEGCSSSESGWTMYIDSPMQEDEGDCSTSYNEGDKKKLLTTYRHTDAEDEDGVRSDDSMASDASSGPTYHHHLHNTARSHRDYSKEASRLKQDKKQFATPNKKGKKEKTIGEKSSRRK
ncbi:protein SOB FIVE-LIKE 3-like [Humulus lupulus]|uniref:protein SOB FIVE-LIKE 3-like n=1 Tax=Humulus lupulus TaxID=3486 RepID=UPI002B404ABB|nr:protein SOB FIVE-LIKE 3-like [Humulus lupulus]